MNIAEVALRRSITGPARRAVYILDHWTPEHRKAFREAYYAEEWVRVHQLCVVEFETNISPDRMILNHLMDATEPGERIDRILQLEVNMGELVRKLDSATVAAAQCESQRLPMDNEYQELLGRMGLAEGAALNQMRTTQRSDATTDH